MTNTDTHWSGKSRRPASTATMEPRQEPSGSSSGDRTSATNQRRQLTPVIALLVAVVAAVLAVIAFTHDDVASTTTPIPPAVADDAGPPNAEPVLVPDGVPCPGAPVRGMVPC